ncbi:MAG: hypothetical protein RIG63_09315 [Coleofasciculus chthonoplastes F3-SA18-01]|uniref:hypothetical protein n=1 Tax=Coleofasciculus chthonoplastes TaxID=64178 RepID=UPI0033012E10
MDTIFDFQVGADVLGLASGLTFSQLLLTQAEDNTLISVKNSGEVFATLIGIQVSQISQGDFVVYI